jgi:hypothetical protein
MEVVFEGKSEEKVDRMDDEGDFADTNCESTT